MSSKAPGGGGTMSRMKTISVNMLRDGPRTAWGFRVVGGADLGAPLTVQRVQVGSPAEGALRRGDIIRKIGDYDARDLSHKEAQNLLKTAGNNVNVVVQRSSAASFTSSFSSSMTSSTTQQQHTFAPAAPMVNPPVAGGVATPFTAASLPRSSSMPRASTPGGASHAALNVVRSGTPGRAASPMPASMSEALKSPVESLPHTLFPVPPTSMAAAAAGGPPPRSTSPFPCFQPPPTSDPEMEAVTNQPYRTTPLVLPGAKTKKDLAPTTSSYLRHHPNPMFRAPPSHFDHDAMMRQKVAGTVIDRVAGQDMNGPKIVHKQFNSPIGLYSDQNIAETIQQQTGATPPKPPPVFDPLKSEAYKALKEEELGITEPSGPAAEVSPVQPKVFQPGAVPPPKARPQPPAPQAHSQPQPHKVVPNAKVNSIGSEEKIAQSYSFRRIMAEVLGESEF
ncbi:proteoglycan 4 isoform X2 [Ischnura elegans]|uniref:proteoglycan 4 isoform X2 n=1 Tax=Ischnura elegans TaxID=197161 RepID=UPI001ED8B010|nr:proteoglycan 4 isoform X2 [Ischnura elegans]